MLRLWLPLNGDLHNQGLDDVTITSTSLEFVDGGKIGAKCSKGSSGWFAIPSMAGAKQMSFAYWGKLNAVTSTNWLDSFSWYTTNGSSSHRSRQEFYYSTGTSMTTGVWYYNKDNSGFTGQQVGVWYHYAFTIDYEKGKSEFYIDGELKKTTSDVNTGYYVSGNNFLFQESGLDYSMNDLRIYDNILSPKEVKELSKGLVLHYPLNRGGFGADNLMKNTEVSSSNQTAISMTSSTEIVTEDGYLCYKVTNANTAGHFYGVGVTLSANTTYTYSAWIKCNQNVNLNFTSLGHFSVINNASTASDKTHEDVVAQRIYRPSSVIANKWTKISITFTTNALDGSTFGVYPKYNLGATYELFIRDMKLELGDTPTPWLPNSADTLYQSMGLNNNIEYDVSGYQNNGSIIGALTYSSDTPRYMVSTYFNGGDNAITVPFNSVISDATIPFTINLWFKKSELGTDNYESLFGGPSGFEMDTRSGNATSLSLYMALTRGGAVYSPFNLNEWYMVTMASDRTNEYYYVNGELSKTITAKSMPVGNYFIGAWQVYNKQNYKGLISDFRIYSTCLSADDILALYNAPTSIASNGTLLTQGEIVEV